MMLSLKRYYQISLCLPFMVPLAIFAASRVWMFNLFSSSHAFFLTNIVYFIPYCIFVGVAVWWLEKYNVKHFIRFLIYLPWVFLPFMLCFLLLMGVHSWLMLLMTTFFCLCYGYGYVIIVRLLARFLKKCRILPSDL